MSLRAIGLTLLGSLAMACSGGFGIVTGDEDDDASVGSYDGSDGTGGGKVCGDGIRGADEQCDMGNRNGETVCGCTALCTYAASVVPCGSTKDDECTHPDRCDGHGACDPVDELLGASCGDPTETECDAPDGCDGVGSCVLMLHQPGSPCGDPSDTACSGPDTCDGTGTCLANDERVDFGCGLADTACSDPDTCDGAGTCLANDAPAGTPCQDASDTDCTDPDACDATGTCRANDASVGTSCGDPTDGDCTDPDACDREGHCLVYDLPEDSACTDDGSECTRDECRSGTCAHEALRDDSACGSGADSDCTDPDTCVGGVCLSNDESAGTGCGSAVDTACTDRDDCDGAGTCRANDATVGTLCGDPTDGECTDPDDCDGAGTCLAYDLADDAPCTDDGSDCTRDECLAGVCAHPALANETACGSAADTECTDPDTCDDGVCLSHDRADGLACDDDDLFCTGEESCGGGVCLSSGSPCDPGTEICEEGDDRCERTASGPVDVDPILGWHFPVPGWTEAIVDEGRVEALLFLGDWIYVGGNFVRTEDHLDPATVRFPTYLTAQDSDTGEDQDAFAPDLDGRVHALARSDEGDAIYVGGNFTEVNGESRPSLVALDPATGETLDEIPDLDISGGAVWDIAISGDEMWIGGDFWSVSGVLRQRLAKLVRDGGVWALDLDWNQHADTRVHAIELDLPDRVFIGGSFLQVDDVDQAYIAALDAESGALLEWDAFDDDNVVFDFARDADTLYVAVGGKIDHGNEGRAYRLSDGHRRWYYHTDGDVQAVAVDGDRIVWGHHGDFVANDTNRGLGFVLDDGIWQPKIFITRASDGSLEDWDPDMGIASNDDGSNAGGTMGVWAVACSPAGDLFVGGDFTEVGPVVQQRFAIFQSLGVDW